MKKSELLVEYSEISIEYDCVHATKISTDEVEFSKHSEANIR